MVLREPGWGVPAKELPIINPIVGERTMEAGVTESFFISNDRVNAATMRRRSPEARNNRVDDNFLSFPELNMFVVFDGVGQSDGAEASFLAATRMKEKIEEMRSKMNQRIEDLDTVELVTFFKIVVKAVNQDLVMRNMNREKSEKLFTTLTLVGFAGEEMVMVAIGDSPGFIQKNEGELEQITVDSDAVREHFVKTKGFPSEINEMTGLGVDQVANLRQAQKNRPPILRNRLTHFLGKEATALELRKLPIDVYVRSVEPGDKILITSDGLTKQLENQDLEQRLRDIDERGVQSVADTLMTMASVGEEEEYHDDKVFTLIEVK